MKIDINKKQIFIETSSSDISSTVKSQLYFWNFEPDYSNNVYFAPLERQLFIKLINHLKEEQIRFEFKDAAKKYSQELEVIKSNFEIIKQTAANFKNGNFDKLKFDEFREFVAGNIKRPLKIHQLKAAFHLYLLGNGANFSVPGSGKTSVVITVYEKLRVEGKVNTLFVVGPASCFGPWKNEFYETLGREPKYRILAGGQKTYRKSQYYHTQANKLELYLTTFQSLLSDQKEVNDFLNQKYNSVYFVVDEAHYIKQIKGNWAQAILKQSEKTKYRCVLTGTPMPRSYTDVFNLFDFLWPNQSSISSNNKSLIKYNEELGNRHSVKIIMKDSIGPLFYRVRKVDLHLMPQNFLQPELISMGKYEQLIYTAIYKRIKDYSKKDYFKNIELINRLGRGRIMRLRQSISYPKLLNTAIDDYDENLFNDLTDLKNIIKRYDNLEVPAKIKYLIKKVKQLQRKKLKLVIWSNFIETLKLIEKHLKQEGFHCKKIYGHTPVEGTTIKDAETRERIRDEFVDPESGLDILIANPAACSESISLHKTCHHAMYYDLSYNCAQYLQSLDRIHRVGGSEYTEANYHFLQYKSTIDIDIKRNIDTKTKKMFEIIDDDYTINSLNMFEQDGDAEAYNRIFIKEPQQK